MTNFVALRCYGAAGAVNMHQLQGGIYIDTARPVTGVTQNANTQRRGNRLVKWIGPTGHRWFAACPNLAATYLLESDDDGATWAQVAGLPVNLATGQGYLNGMVPITGSDGLTYLTWIAFNAGNTTRYGFRYSDAGGWTATSLSALAPINQVEAYPFQGVVHYFDTSGAPNAQRWDPVANTAALVTVGGTNLRTGAFFTLGTRLFVAASKTDNTGLRLYELQFGSWVIVSEAWVSYVGNTGTTADGRFGIVHLPGNRVLLLGPGNNGGGLGLEAVLITVAGSGVPTPTRKTVTAIPVALQGPSLVGSPGDFSCVVVADNQESPGSPINYVFFSADGGATGSPVELLEIDATDPDNPVLVDVGPTQITGEYSLGSIPAWGGGHGLWTPGERSCQIIDTAADAAGLRIFYRVAGDPGGPGKTISFRFLSSFGIPVNVSSLVPGSAVGGAVSGDTIVGVVADPAEVREVVWDFLADGQPDARYGHLQAFVLG